MSFLRKKIIRVVTIGGLGDMLLTTPAIAMLKKKFPNSRIVIFCSLKAYPDVFINNPHVDKITSISFFRNPISYIRYKYKLGEFYSFHYGGLFPSLFFNKPAQDIIADTFKVQLEDRRVQVFLTDKEDAAAKAIMSTYKNPVIVHIATWTTQNKEWPIKNWQSLIDSMPECTFIQVGLATEPALERVVDLRGKHSFREFMGIVKHAKSFAGVDSSFSHLTSAFNIPGVIVFGPSLPAIWGHPNNINIYKKVRCSPCIDLLKGPCPYGKPCMTNITVDEVREALQFQLHKGQAPEVNVVNRVLSSTATA